MKSLHPTLLAIGLLHAASAKDITVSPGDSLENARDAAKSGHRIVLRGGTYRLDKTLVCGPQHSGITQEQQRPLRSHPGTNQTNEQGDVMLENW